MLDLANSYRQFARGVLLIGLVAAVAATAAVWLIERRGRRHRPRRACRRRSSTAGSSPSPASSWPWSRCSCRPHGADAGRRRDRLGDVAGRGAPVAPAGNDTRSPKFTPPPPPAGASADRDRRARRLRPPSGALRGRARARASAACASLISPASRSAMTARALRGDHARAGSPRARAAPVGARRSRRGPRSRGARSRSWSPDSSRSSSGCVVRPARPLGARSRRGRPGSIAARASVELVAAASIPSQPTQRTTSGSVRPWPTRVARITREGHEQDEVALREVAGQGEGRGQRDRAAEARPAHERT